MINQDKKKDKEKEKSKINVEVGNRIKAIRNFLRYRQKEFAGKLGIANSSLSEIESGQTRPGFDFLVSISRVFNANLYYILFGTGEMIIEQGEIDDKLAAYYAANKQEIENFFYHFRGSSILQFKILAYFKTVMMNKGEAILREINEKTGKSAEPRGKKE
jgi:transcriptional regulator with XRE-family HTH domain